MSGALSSKQSFAPNPSEADISKAIRTLTEFFHANNHSDAALAADVLRTRMLRQDEEIERLRAVVNVAYEECSREGCHCPGELKGGCAFCRIGAAIAGLPVETSGEQYLVRTFWSPDRQHLVTAHVTKEGIVAMQDDNGVEWEAAGDQQNMGASQKPTEDTGLLMRAQVLICQRVGLDNRQVMNHGSVEHEISQGMRKWLIDFADGVDEGSAVKTTAHQVEFATWRPDKHGMKCINCDAHFESHIAGSNRCPSSALKRMPSSEEQLDQFIDPNGPNS